MKIKDLPKHLRPREKLIGRGAENLQDKELLAILIRTGKAGKNAIQIASEILKQHPMKRLIELSYDELIKIGGIDSGKACSLLASFELTKRALELHENSLPLVQSPQDVVHQLSQIRNKKKEYFIALYLNARNELLLKETISVGTLTSSLVHPREVFEPAVRISAAAVILAHNHPSGNLEPSQADLQVTCKLKQSGDILGIEVIDHIIITDKGYSSIIEKVE